MFILLSKLYLITCNYILFSIRYNSLTVPCMSKNLSLTILILLMLGLAVPACSPVESTLPALGTPQTTSAPTTGYNVSSPTEPYRGYLQFDHYGLEQGLSQSTVNCIIQDQQGFMWFGTQDGLDRFDGYNFKIYTTDPENPRSPSDRWITALATDEEGNLWIGTRLGGLNMFTPSTGNFIQYRHSADDLASLSSDTITTLLMDKDGTLWVGTPESLDKLNLRSGTFTHYYNQPGKPNTPGANQINAIYQDVAGTIWTGTTGGGLASFDPATGQFTHYTHDDQKLTSIGADTVRVITGQPGNKLWVVTDIGVDLYDKVSGIFSHFTFSPTLPNGLSSSEVLSAIVDRGGNLWVGTKNGLDRLDEATGKFKHYRHDPTQTGTISANEILYLYEDRNAGLWIGTLGGGINYFNPIEQNFIYFRHDPASIFSLSSNLVYSFYVEQSGIAWVGTYGGGLDRFNPLSEQFTHFVHDPENPASLVNDFIWSVFRDSSGRLWVGTEGGLDLFNEKSEQFTHYQHQVEDPQSLSSNTIHKIFEDHFGNLWIGTSAGLDRFDPVTETFSHYAALNDTSGVTRDPVIAIMEDRQGFIWVGTFNKGLYRLDRNYIAFAFYQNDPKAIGSLSNNSVLSIFQDRDAVIWIGTSGGGLNRYDPVTDSFTAITEKDGLPSGVVYSIQQDDTGFLWLSTNNGISQYDPKTGAFKNFTVGNGLQSNEFSMNAYAQGSDGAIYLGGVNGFNIFYPDNLHTNTAVPPVVLTSLTQDGNPISTPLTVGFTKQFTVSYPKTSFEFEFTALNYEESGMNQFAYMLEKFDSSWNRLGSNHFGRYTNLPGGNYTFHLIAANNDGVWNNEGVSIKVTVIPPFWQTWWFRIAAIVALAGLAAGIFQYRTRSITRRNLELERLVKIRTSEMERLFEKTKELAVVEERNRLARELHDSAKQKAFAAMAQIGTAGGKIDHDQASIRRHLTEAENLIYEVIQELTYLIQEIYPLALKEKGLEAMLRQYVFEWESRNEIRVDVQMGYPQRLPLDAEQALYRITQEAFANIARHSHATQVKVVLNYVQKAVDLDIQDNGVGFDPETKANGLGLRLIRERAEKISGWVMITSAPGKGTSIHVHLNDQPPAAEEKANE